MSDHRYYWDIKRVLVIPSMGNNSAEPPLNELLDKGWEYMGREVLSEIDRGVNPPQSITKLVHVIGLPRSIDEARNEKTNGNIEETEKVDYYPHVPRTHNPPVVGDQTEKKPCKIPGCERDIYLAYVLKPSGQEGWVPKEPNGQPHGPLCKGTQAQENIQQLE